MIIDSHVHIGSSLGFELKAEDVIYSMEKYNIDYAIISSISGAEFDHELNEVPKDMQVSQLECLEECLQLARKYPNKIGVAVWVRPHNECVDETLKRAIADNIDVIKAIKLHAYHSKTATDSKAFEPFIQLAREFDLPIIIHTGDGETDNPKTVYNAAKQNTDINFIMAHMGLGTDNKEAIELACKLPNLYGDTTWVSVKSTLDFMKKSSSEKVMFGSDNPIDGKDTYLHNRTGDRSLYQEYFNEFKEMISDEDYQNIMWKNAVKIFKLDEVIK